MKYKDNYKIFCLFVELKARGILEKALGYEMSPCYKHIIIYYCDENLNKNYLFITRTSRICYWCFYEGKYLTFRRQYKIIEFLDTFLMDCASWHDFKHSLKGVDYWNYFSSTENQQHQKYNEFRRTERKRLGLE
ncbi:MAG: hypothetical protein FWE22_08505 [Firmicutes bacterium]|nr:hypothetical protein [Bacillota bacterium]